MKTPLIFPFARCVASVLAALILVGATLRAQSAPPASSAPPTATANVPENPFGPRPALPAVPSSPSIPGNTTASSPAPADGDFVAVLRQALLQRFDKDGKGTLSAAEIIEARDLFVDEKNPQPLTPAQSLAAQRGPLFGLRRLIMLRFDKNDDGTLDATELAEARNFILGESKTNAPTDLDNLRTQIIQHFSKKGDGALDDAGRAAAKAWLQQMINDLDKNAPASSAQSAPPKATLPTATTESPVSEVK